MCRESNTPELSNITNISVDLSPVRSISAKLKPVVMG